MPAIATFDEYIAAQKEEITFSKSASTTAIAGQPTSIFDLAGNPAAGTLAGANTANGVVPTDATAGFPLISNFVASGIGSLTRIEFANTVAARHKFYDCLWKGGAYAFNANVAVTPPSFSSRVPGGTNFKGLEIWIETVTAFTGTPSFNITFTNQDGTTGQVTGVTAAPAALGLKRMFKLPMPAGSNGVQAITNVACTVATAGTFNVLVLRPLVGPMRVKVANDGDVYGIDRTGLEQMFQDMALFLIVWPDSTSTGLPDLVVEIVNK
jgi:hypothetical protein